MPPPRTSRAGESLEDFCRACKTDRLHTVIVVDANGTPIRVACGYCHSEHNYRGGPRIDAPSAARSTLRVISPVVAVCSSTAAAIVVV